MGRLKQVGIDVEVHRLIEQHRRSFLESTNDILSRILPLIPPAAPPSPIRVGSASPMPGTRNRGQWTVEIEGRRIAAGSLKAAYRTFLITLSERSPEFLTRFAEEKGRSRRFVARTPGGLYGASPHLAKDHAELLADGWYFDTNLSAEQVASRVRIAARLCGLRYGADVRILENLREI
ncbi:MAG TPA: hypothetical protein VFP12_11640 [Allosphingosinicella sp.]|nr:hypothetical protein [Allosphingosinicella sp.]